MDMRTRFLALVLPLFVASQAAAMNLPGFDGGSVAPVIALSQTITKDYQLASANDGIVAQGMIERLGNEAIRTISNQSLDESAKKQVFKRLLTQNFDMSTIGRFAMGKFWRTATPQQQSEYQRLYERMIIDVYTARFNKYSGQIFEVTGNRVDESGDIVVSSNVKSDGTPIAVDWRVRPKGGAYRIIDVMVEGVSMAVTQRNDFAGVIQQGGGTVDALLDYLKKGGTSDVKK
ncbi:MAG: ABC transporter substrate-binding protein [Proteobacteria bacterium]|nr:ABC transporter substrate-binding protein [Pseudomonadota bacterium]